MVSALSRFHSANAFTAVKFLGTSLRYRCTWVLNMSSLVCPPHSLLLWPPTRLTNDWPQVETHPFIFLRTPEDISIVFLVKIWSLLRNATVTSGSFSGDQDWIFFTGSWSVSSSDHGDQNRWCLCLSVCTVLWQQTQKIPRKQTWRNIQL